ncbi:hypothetical protein WJ969_06450 [Achromobacter xylosoxidans]
MAQRMLSQKTVQHEAVLATLAALSHPPAPERLFPSLRPAMPQLRALGYLPDGAWAGSARSRPACAPPWRRPAAWAAPSRCRWTPPATGWCRHPAGACWWTRATCSPRPTFPPAWPT